uniref:hypothetical protein n=1 Tax=Bifidobacterium adolescentis TaxID=1680 RepID=UPI003FEE914D
MASLASVASIAGAAGSFCHRRLFWFAKLDARRFVLIAMSVCFVFDCSTRRQLLVLRSPGCGFRG